MAKVKLEFDLFEESEALEDAINATKYRAMLDDVSQYCRQQIKHCDHPEMVDEMLQEIRELAMVRDF